MWMTYFPSTMSSLASLTLAVHDDVKPISDTQSCIDTVHDIYELSHLCTDQVFLVLTEDSPHPVTPITSTL